MLLCVVLCARLQSIADDLNDDLVETHLKWLLICFEPKFASEPLLMLRNRHCFRGAKKIFFLIFKIWVFWSWTHRQFFENFFTLKLVFLMFKTILNKTREIYFFSSSQLLIPIQLKQISIFFLGRESYLGWVLSYPIW